MGDYDYRWFCSPLAAKFELAGHNVQWLRNALRERGITPGKMKRADMIAALVQWQKEAGL
jgi:hypothetical protein